MKKTTAIAIFGTTQVELAEAIGVTKARISQLPEDLDQPTTDRVIGAAYRLGKADRLPLEFRIHAKEAA